MDKPEDGGCLCGSIDCDRDHPDEAAYVELAKSEAPGILERVKAGIKPGIMDRILLRMAGIKVPRWPKKRERH